jgi:hypothetical protein
MTSKPFNQASALRIIGNVCQKYDISLEDLRAAFPQRPTNDEEFLAIANWMQKVWESRNEKATSINPPRPSAQARPKYVTAEMLPEGNYAVPGKDGGKTRFYRVSHKAGKGKWAGTTFVNIKQRVSDDLFELPNRASEAAAKWSIVEFGYEASRLLFAEKYDSCWHCFKGLTDEDNPYKVHGLGPVCGPKVMG